MFPKSNSFYLTGLFKVLCEIWLIYYMYPFNVIVVKMAPKWGIAFLHVIVAQKTLYFFEIHLTWLKKYCSIGSI